MLICLNISNDSDHRALPREIFVCLLPATTTNTHNLWQEHRLRAHSLLEGKLSRLAPLWLLPCRWKTLLVHPWCVPQYKHSAATLLLVEASTYSCRMIALSELLTALLFSPHPSASCYSCNRVPGVFFLLRPRCRLRRSRESERGKREGEELHAEIFVRSLGFS